MIKTYIVDSFTDKAFKGNPAGVCLLSQEISDALMLSVAKELGLSETAFICQQEKENHYSIRYFSPKMEIPLCGHATLASAKVLLEKNDIDEIHFLTIQNLDLCVRRADHEIIMEFPVYEMETTIVPSGLLKALGITTINNAAYNKETNILLLEINETQVLKDLRPDFEALYQAHDSINGVLVTTRSTDDVYDFHSRYFWPWSGTNEDPVTGGTHTFLAKYWGKRLNKTKMKSFQSSDRSGFMEVELIGDDKLTIKSQAVIIFEGALKI